MRGDENRVQTGDTATEWIGKADAMPWLVVGVGEGTQPEINAIVIGQKMNRQPDQILHEPTRLIWIMNEEELAAGWSEALKRPDWVRTIKPNESGNYVAATTYPGQNNPLIFGPAQRVIAVPTPSDR